MACVGAIFDHGLKRVLHVSPLQSLHTATIYAERAATPAHYAKDQVSIYKPTESLTTFMELSQ